MNGHFIFVAIVGPVLMGGPPLLAVWLCERHANQSAAAIRAQCGEQVPAQTRPAPVRPAIARTKELTR